MNAALCKKCRLAGFAHSEHRNLSSQVTVTQLQFLLETPPKRLHPVSLFEIPESDCWNENNIILYSHKSIHIHKEKRLYRGFQHLSPGLARTLIQYGQGNNSSRFCTLFTVANMSLLSTLPVPLDCNLCFCINWFLQRLDFNIHCSWLIDDISCYENAVWIKFSFSPAVVLWRSPSAFSNNLRGYFQPFEGRKRHLQLGV